MVTEALEIMDDGLILGMGIVGIKFRENFIFVPEVLACARAMKAGMAHIEPILSDAGIEPIGYSHNGNSKRGPTRHRKKPMYHDAARCRVCRPRFRCGYV